MQILSLSCVNVKKKLLFCKQNLLELTLKNK